MYTYLAFFFIWHVCFRIWLSWQPIRKSHCWPRKLAPVTVVFIMSVIPLRLLFAYGLRIWLNDIHIAGHQKKQLQCIQFILLHFLCLLISASRFIIGILKIVISLVSLRSIACASYFPCSVGIHLLMEKCYFGIYFLSLYSHVYEPYLPVCLLQLWNVQMFITSKLFWWVWTG